MTHAPRRRVPAAERRARLVRRHHLTGTGLAADLVEAARDQVGLHATDPASVFLSAAARTGTPSPVAIERSLYTQRTVVRTLGMRRTMFCLPLDLVPVVQAACTRAIAVRERRRLVELLEQAGIASDGAGWLRRVEEATVAALATRGEAVAAELSADVPDLRRQIEFGAGTKWQGRQSVSTRVLFLLAADGRIMRGRPRGSWTSSQYRWATTDAWLPAGVGDLETEPARVELVRRWLRAYGPGTVADIRWWTGWTAGETKRALSGVGPVEVELDGGIGLVLADDVEMVDAAEPEAALLPALDPTVMGWTDRDWYLGEHGPALFDRNGNAGPTVWWDGRIVGGWAQRKDGEVVLRMLEDAGGDALAAVHAAADRLRAWLGDVRVTPRFRTPLERELSA